ncbi:MAG TPA: hypothetical protein PKY78_00035 [Candidatus Omnitrophota bacterium]|nr:hypothetical protein [Candidatus Omnitrophota bacterium]
MKKFFVIVIAGIFLSLSLVAAPVYAENVFDKIGDWWATRGKSDMEKNMILTQRKAARAAKEAEKEMNKTGKEMNKQFDKAFGK